MIAGFALGAVVVGLVAGGMALRKSRVVTGSVTISAPDETVYELVSDLKTGWPQWSPLVPEGDGITLEYDAQTSGKGAKVRWTGRAGSGALELTDCAPGLRVSYGTTMSLGGMSAVGRIDLQRRESAVVVSWSDELSVGTNPLWRWLAFAMDGLRKKNVAQGLAALKRASEGHG
jgi:hypothetical protein